MSTTVLPQSPTAGRPGLMSALEGIVTACGLDFDPVAARDAVCAAETAASGHLAHAARDVGVRVVRADWSVREALDNVGSGAVLAVESARSPDVWFVLAERRGSRLRLDTGEWLTGDALAARLGLAGVDARAEWAVARPMMPAGDIGGPPPGGHGHGDDGHGGHGHGPSPLRRMLGLFKAEWRDLWVVAIFSLGVGILSLSIPIAVETLVSNVQGGNAAMMQVVIVLSLALLFALGLGGAMRALTTFVVELMQRRIFVRIVNELSYRLPRVSVKEFDRQHGPELANRFFDILTVQKASATLLLDGVAVVIQALVGLAILAIWHPLLLGFTVGVLVALGILILFIGRGAIRAKIRESYAKYAVAGWLEEMVRHPVAFKSPPAQEYAFDRADELTREYLLARRDSFGILFRQILFGIVLQAGATALLFGLGGWIVVRNELTMAQLVAAELILAVMLGSFVKLGKSLESYYDLMAAMDKVGHLVDLNLERDGKPQGEHLPASGDPAGVEVRGLDFHFHDGHRGVPVFHGFDASIRPGERVALEGSGGSGKSTLMDLLDGLREPDGGRILLDGVDLRDIRLESLREHVASVAGGEVFEGTILDNVRMGRPHVTLADVRAALQLVGMMDVVQGLSDGLHTKLTTGGAPLSHGHSDRLVLARAVAGRPRLLLLDETLDHIDEDSRRRLLPGLFDRNAPWTVIVATNNAEVRAACGRVLRLPGSDHDPRGGRDAGGHDADGHPGH